MSVIEYNKEQILNYLMNKDNNIKSSAITLLSKDLGGKDLSENAKEIFKSFKTDLIKLKTDDFKGYKVFDDFIIENINTFNEKVIVEIINLLKNIIKFKEKDMINVVKQASSQDNFKEIILKENIEKEMQYFLKLVLEFEGLESIIFEINEILQEYKTSKSITK